MERMVLQHPRVLELKGQGKPKLAFIGTSPGPKRPGEPDSTDSRKRIKACLWERELPEESTETAPLSHDHITPSSFQEVFLDALVEDRANLINENLLLKKRITELTAQVLALQLFMEEKKPSQS